MKYEINIKGKTKKQVTKLNLSGCGLKEIPENVFEYLNLTKLVLSNNKIKTIPKEIQQLKKLKVLDLANLENAEKKGVKIMPVMVSPCETIEESGLLDYQAPNGPDKTLIEMTKGEVHRTLSKLVKDIKSFIDNKK